MTSTSPTPVMPDLIRHPASSLTTEGSETPDQVRGDDQYKPMMVPWLINIMAGSLFLASAVSAQIPNNSAIEKWHGCNQNVSVSLAKDAGQAIFSDRQRLIRAIADVAIAHCTAELARAGISDASAKNLVRQERERLRRPIYEQLTINDTEGL